MCRSLASCSPFPRVPPSFPESQDGTPSHDPFWTLNYFPQGGHSIFVAISNAPLLDVIPQQIQTAHLAVEEKYGENRNDCAMINSISMQEVSDILEFEELKLSLKRFLPIDPRKITEVRKKTSISRIVRSNHSLIEKLFLASAEADLEVTLASLMEFLLAKTESEDITSQALGVAFSRDVISENTMFNSGL